MCVLSMSSSLKFYYLSKQFNGSSLVGSAIIDLSPTPDLLTRCFFCKVFIDYSSITLAVFRSHSYSLQADNRYTVLRLYPDYFLWMPYWKIPQWMMSRHTHPNFTAFFSTSLSESIDFCHPARVWQQFWYELRAINANVQYASSA